MEQEKKYHGFCHYQVEGKSYYHLYNRNGKDDSFNDFKNFEVNLKNQNVRIINNIWFSNELDSESLEILIDKFEEARKEADRK
jgi:hypothetical protein